MKLIKKVTAGFLVSLGGVIVLSGVYAPFNHEIDREEQMSQAIACLIFGLPMTGVGGWMFWSLYQQGEKEKRDRLQSAFFKLLEEGKGQITVLRFAKETHLPGEEAKQFLDAKAKEFNATVDVDEIGGIFYCFHQ
jgi:hypothetical protein